MLEQTLLQLPDFITHALQALLEKWTDGMGNQPAIVFAGDMNSEEDSSVYELLTKVEFHLLF